MSCCGGSGPAEALPFASRIAPPRTGLSSLRSATTRRNSQLAWIIHRPRAVFTARVALAQGAAGRSSRRWADARKASPPATRRVLTTLVSRLGNAGPVGRRFVPIPLTLQSQYKTLPGPLVARVEVNPLRTRRFQSAAPSTGNGLSPATAFAVDGDAITQCFRCVDRKDAVAFSAVAGSERFPRGGQARPWMLLVPVARVSASGDSLIALWRRRLVQLLPKPVSAARVSQTPTRGGVSPFSWARLVRR